MIINVIPEIISLNIRVAIEDFNRLKTEELLQTEAVSLQMLQSEEDNYVIYIFKSETSYGSHPNFNICCKPEIKPLKDIIICNMMHFSSAFTFCICVLDQDQQTEKQC